MNVDRDKHGAQNESNRNFEINTKFKAKRRILKSIFCLYEHVSHGRCVYLLISIEFPVAQGLFAHFVQCKIFSCSVRR